MGARRPFTLRVCWLLLLAVISHVSVASASGRERRQEDPNPLAAVVNGLTAAVTQLTAKLEAQAADLEQLSRGTSEPPVAFSVAHSDTDIQNLTAHEPVQFDNVIYNAGSGYDPATGRFTAPSSGTYAFFVHITRHTGGDTIQLGIWKGMTELAFAYACCTQFNGDSNMAVIHLDEGDTVHAEMDHGTMIQGIHSTFTGFKVSPL